jgi:hypothetical protein
MSSETISNSENFPRTNNHIVDLTICSILAPKLSSLARERSYWQRSQRLDLSQCLRCEKAGLLRFQYLLRIYMRHRPLGMCDTVRCAVTRHVQLGAEIARLSPRRNCQASDALHHVFVPCKGRRYCHFCSFKERT